MYIYLGPLGKVFTLTLQEYLSILGTEKGTLRNAPPRHADSSSVCHSPLFDRHVGSMGQYLSLAAFHRLCSELWADLQARLCNLTSAASMGRHGWPIMGQRRCC